MKAGAIHVHIDRLILRGLPLSGGDGNVLSGALTEELTRLLRTRGWANPVCASEPHRPPPLPIAPQAGPAMMGRQIAARVHAQLAVPPSRAKAPSTPRLA